MAFTVHKNGLPVQRKSTCVVALALVAAGGGISPNVKLGDDAAAAAAPAQHASLQPSLFANIENAGQSRQASVPISSKQDWASAVWLRSLIRGWHAGRTCILTKRKAIVVDLAEVIVLCPDIFRACKSRQSPASHTPNGRMQARVQWLRQHEAAVPATSWWLVFDRLPYPHAVRTRGKMSEGQSMQSLI